MCSCPAAEQAALAEKGGAGGRPVATWCRSSLCPSSGAAAAPGRLGQGGAARQSRRLRAAAPAPAAHLHRHRVAARPVALVVDEPPQLEGALHLAVVAVEVPDRYQARHGGQPGGHLGHLQPRAARQLKRDAGGMAAAHGAEQSCGRAGCRLCGASSARDQGRTWS
jgi:hypothetical protein